jgi:hypothetical protein
MDEHILKDIHILKLNILGCEKYLTLIKQAYLGNQTFLQICNAYLYLSDNRSHHSAMQVSVHIYLGTRERHGS